MPTYAMNDRVELTAARGGWDGYVSRVLNGPGGAPLYEVRSPARGNRDEGTQLVLPADISQGLTPTSFPVGQGVNVGGMGGTVQSDNGDGTYTVTVNEVLNKHMTVTRTHIVPLWLLAVENGG